jgi:hypothetical protein
MGALRFLNLLSICFSSCWRDKRRADESFLFVTYSLLLSERFFGFLYLSFGLAGGILVTHTCVHGVLGKGQGWTY